MEPSISQLIVQMVSPAVMVSACGLMLLGLGNKYARVVDRIRVFAAEVRALRKLAPQATEADRQRLRILEVQIPDLFRRGKLLRNALLYFYMAIASFVVCSFLIPLTKSWPPLALFAIGMACVLVAVVLAWRETLLSFRLINLEVAFRPEAQTLE
jgi:small-conductance mechanosensitive channel